MSAAINGRRTVSAGTDSTAGIVGTRRLAVVPTDSAPDHRAPPIHLTARQLEVLALLCEGLPNKLICRRLNISAGTVKAHISSILRELGVSSRLQAVVCARRRGLVSDLNAPEDQHDFGQDDQPLNATATTFRRNRAMN